MYTRVYVHSRESRTVSWERKHDSRGIQELMTRFYLFRVLLCDTLEVVGFRHTMYSFILPSFFFFVQVAKTSAVSHARHAVWNGIGTPLSPQSRAVVNILLLHRPQTNHGPLSLVCVPFGCRRRIPKSRQGSGRSSCGACCRGTGPRCCWTAFGACGRFGVNGS